MRRRELVRALTALVVLEACSDQDGPVGRPPGPVTVQTEALSAPHNPLACTLHDECNRWGTLIDEAFADPSVCDVPSSELRELAWHADVGAVSCPFGSCQLLDVQLAAEPDGQLLALSRVELPPTMPRGREGGLWLARYGARGESAGGALVDFAVPPPGVDVARHAALLLGSGGDPLLATARDVLPGDEPRPLSLAPIAGRRQPQVRPATVSTPPSRATITAIGLRDEVLVASVYRVSDQPNDPNEIPWDAVFRPEYPQRAVLTLHDRHGRQLWSRPWLAGDASTEIEGLRTDSLGRITVLVAIDRGPTNGSVLAQLDRQGRVLWQRLVVDPTRSARLASDGLGNVFVMSSLSFEEPGVLIRRFDRDGHNPAAWKVPLFGSPSFNDGAGKVWLSSFADGPELELWTLPLSADGPSCEGQRYAWPQQLDSFFSIPTLVESEAGDVFCGTSLTIAKLSGGTP